MRFRRKFSLKTQIISAACLLVAGSIILCLILNTTLLERYYTLNKRQGMMEDFQTMNVASQKEELEDDNFAIDFENMCATDNIKMVVFSADGDMILSSVNDIGSMRDELMSMVINTNQGTLLESNDQFAMVRERDTRLGSDYLILYGTLENGEMILMRTPLESIHESAGLANQFLLIVGLIMIGVSVICSLYLAGRITNPILELTDISNRMVKLDFDAKYDPRQPIWRKYGRKERKAYKKHLKAMIREDAKTGNEVDQLGSHMNVLSANLEQTISELKSANVELQKDIERKTQIDEMRKEFLSNVSHELKTPIALIQGYAEGLQEFSDDPESRDFYCEVIIDEADKMNNMVKKLLTLNQLEFGNEQVTMERFNMTELVTGVVNATQILREQDGIELEMDLPDEVCVWGDEFKVEEVITNFMSNAIHHCDGDKKIRVFYTQKEDVLRVSVFNTGTPIPEADVPFIWDKFYKVDKARTREYGGNGIGLSIVKAIMDSFHQECGVINHEDGVEFWMELSTK